MRPPERPRQWFDRLARLTCPYGIPQHLESRVKVWRSIPGISFVVAALLVSACSAAATPAPSAGGGSAVPGTRIEVKLTDALKIEPAAFTVKAGVPVTFVVMNTGAIEHEFFIGDEKAQADHEKEMARSGAMAHDDPMGIGVKPGQTKELTVTLKESGVLLAGCHIPGHYPAGMKATVTVQ